MSPTKTADRWSKEDGSSLVEMAFILPVLLLILAGTIDLGRTFYYSNELASAAGAGAIYGSQNPTDTAGIQEAAKLDAQDVPGLQTSTSYGCECSDGSARSTDCATVPSCSANEVYYVTVTASAKYKPVIPWPVLPSSYALTATSTMRSGE